MKVRHRHCSAQRWLLVALFICTSSRDGVAKEGLGKAAEFVVGRDRISTIMVSLVRWKMKKKKQNVPELFESWTNNARTYDDAMYVAMTSDMTGSR